MTDAQQKYNDASNGENIRREIWAGEDHGADRRLPTDEIGDFALRQLDRRLRLFSQWALVMAEDMMRRAASESYRNLSNHIRGARHTRPMRWMTHAELREFARWAKVPFWLVFWRDRPAAYIFEVLCRRHIRTGKTGDALVDGRYKRPSGFTDIGISLLIEEKRGLIEKVMAAPRR